MAHALASMASRYKTPPKICINYSDTTISSCCHTALRQDLSLVRDSINVQFPAPFFQPRPSHRTLSRWWVHGLCPGEAFFVINGIRFSVQSLSSGRAVNVRTKPRLLSPKSLDFINVRNNHQMIGAYGPYRFSTTARQTFEVSAHGSTDGAACPASMAFVVNVGAVQSLTNAAQRTEALSPKQRMCDRKH